MRRCIRGQVGPKPGGTPTPLFRWRMSPGDSDGAEITKRWWSFVWGMILTSKKWSIGSMYFKKHDTFESCLWPFSCFKTICGRFREAIGGSAASYGSLWWRSWAKNRFRKDAKLGSLAQQVMGEKTYVFSSPFSKKSTEDLLFQSSSCFKLQKCRFFIRLRRRICLQSPAPAFCHWFWRPLAAAKDSGDDHVEFALSFGSHELLCLCSVDICYARCDM